MSTGELPAVGTTQPHEPVFDNPNSRFCACGRTASAPVHAMPQAAAATLSHVSFDAREPRLVEVPPEAKSLFASKTFWLNALTILAVAVGMVIDAANIYQLTVQQVTTLTIALALLNAVARLWTNRPIAGTPGEKALRKP
jgi:hypothetical protein